MKTKEEETLSCLIYLQYIVPQALVASFDTYQFLRTRVGN
jgi:hypothetical protein